MRIGVFKESLASERRVPLTPEGARALASLDHAVVVEAGSGVGSGFSDTEYLAAGAEIAYTPRELASQADVCLKIHAPSLAETELLREDAALIAFWHLSNQTPALHQLLASRRITTFSMEMVREGADEYPILGPLSAIGGRVAVALATWHLTGPGNGPGILLGGSPGVPPALVLVIGAGAAGSAAACEAAALGAQVVALDRDPRKLAKLEAASQRRVITAIASEFHLSRYLEQADVVIGAVAIRGEPAPKVLRKSHVRTMKEGSLFIDMSIDEGGCADTSRPTSADQPVYVVDGVRHICIPNLPSEVAHTASRAMASSLLPYLALLGRGVHEALATDRALRGAVGFLGGKLVNSGLSRYVSVPFEPLEALVPLRES